MELYYFGSTSDSLVEAILHKSPDKHTIKKVRKAANILTTQYKQTYIPIRYKYAILSKRNEIRKTEYRLRLI